MRKHHRGKKARKLTTNAAQVTHQKNPKDFTVECFVLARMRENLWSALLGAMGEEPNGIYRFRV